MRIRQSILLATTALALTVAAVQPTVADTSDKRIALSNNYAGNSWRQAMLKSWGKNAEQAVSAGTVAAG